MDKYDVIVVGCGLSGCVMAEQFASRLKKTVIIVEKRNHIGGNCYDYIDEETGILVNKYGAHLFHTDNERVWEYVNRFSEWERWEHKVVAHVEDKLIPVPVNITSVNILCGESIKTSDEMDVWLASVQKKFDKISNSDEMGRSRVGDVLFEKIFKQYTKKQWDKYPIELDPSVLGRIPVRNDFDVRYFSDRYQALPKNGYTSFCKNMIDNPLITVALDFDFFTIPPEELQNKIVIYTGPIDTYFKNHELPRLEYRSIDFKQEIIKNINGYFQPNSVVNYPESSVDYTRIVEYKHFLNQKSPHTIIVKEFTSAVGEPYYPIPNEHNHMLYESYKKMSESEKDVHFLGRLATYKYFNMDQAIQAALEYFDKTFG